MILHWAKLKRNLMAYWRFGWQRSSHSWSTECHICMCGDERAAPCRSQQSFHFGTVWFHTGAPQQLFYWPQENWKFNVFPSHHLTTPWWVLSCHFVFPDRMMQRGPLGTAERARAWTQGRGKPVDKMWKGLINMWEISRCQNTAVELSCQLRWSWSPSKDWGMLSLLSGTWEGGSPSGRSASVLHGAAQLRPAASQQTGHDEKEEIFLQDKSFCFQDAAPAVTVLCDQGKS